ncbi:hypothetical protein AX768_31720 (plasmid) [Burkholderia sp. PAMC 28687]|uniref:hypothetical protein n=1 Tax=Burkholderia sp. PAMC 28687 TaxID=1795874 RepID=UPI0007812FBE|nr:hypothetical protein [Burkholderia sp. PAMC 28687]AMM18818.1 hypothetical protein AX768_31720 [Burkholderia sp. PAMC 28687]
MSPHLETALIDRFPAIFALNEDYLEKGVTEHHPIACGDGWFLLINRTCATLNELVRHYASLGYVVPMPLRACVFTDESHEPERDGLLRFDISAQRALNGTMMTHAVRRASHAEGMAWMAAALSADICEVCGNPGKHAMGRVRCHTHVDVSTQDVEAQASLDVAMIIARATDPGAKGAFVVFPKKKRLPQA